ncbi:MAG: sigma-54-dependent Fis family transcriptional regulator [Deltaproteobacteria bacterium]|jgi:two-component system response regulator AtoC|nr:sigma-54-dependent Fis family transcriptional regulator [Deltaproteobacteria bacterium]
MNSGNTPKRLLVIDDEANMRHMLATVLKKTGYVVETASDGSEGLEMIAGTPYDFVLCDIKMPKMDGMEFLKLSREKIGTSTVIMMSAYGSIDTAIEAMKMGAYDYISKPFKTDEVYLTLKKAEERESLKKENRLLKERIQKIEGDYKFHNMVTRSKAMQSLFQMAGKASQYKTTVLILGDSGTGKELIARGIHYSSDRAQKALVPINCGGIPENLLESELFGHKRGAFTGADRNKKGLFQEADGGTIFLDEIGELPLSLQVKLLRVLQENEVRPVGDSKSMKIDVRVVAATAKNLEDEVANGTFRQDLYYRLNVMTIKLPPLRERTEDIPLLCNRFIGQFNQLLDKKISGLAPEAMSRLLEYSWPGNVRELENSIERAMVIADDSLLLPEHFPAEIIDKDRSAPPEYFNGFSLKEAQKAMEERMITRALEETGGNRTRASKLLEISHPSLLTKIKAYNINL